MLWYQVMTEFSIKFNHKNKCASINLEFTNNIIRSWAKGFHQHIKLIHQQDTTSLLYQFIFPTNVSTANFNYSLMCFIVTLNPSIYSRLVQKLCWEINHLDGCLIGWKTMIRNRLLNYSSCKNRPAKFRCQKSGDLAGWWKFNSKTETKSSMCCSQFEIESQFIRWQYFLVCIAKVSAASTWAEWIALNGFRIGYERTVGWFSLSRFSMFWCWHWIPQFKI